MRRPYPSPGPRWTVAVATKHRFCGPLDLRLIPCRTKVAGQNAKNAEYMKTLDRKLPGDAEAEMEQFLRQRRPEPSERV